MFKVTGVSSSTMPGALSLVSITVFAASSEEQQPPTNTTADLKLNLDDLSLYITPEHAKPRHVVEVSPEVGQVERGISALRQTVAPYSAWCRESYGALKPKVAGVLHYGHQGYEYLKDPPEAFFPRAGVIGFLGVVGLLLARRGSRAKRVIYPATLMTVGASMYYPERATEIAKSAGDSVYDGALRGYLYVEQMIRAPQGGSKTTATTTTTTAAAVPAAAEDKP